MGMSTMPKCITLVPRGASMRTPMMEVSVRISCVAALVPDLQREHHVLSRDRGLELDPDRQVVARPHVRHAVVAGIHPVDRAEPHRALRIGHQVLHRRRRASPARRRRWSPPRPCPPLRR